MSKTFYLQKELFETLKQIALEQDRSMSAIVTKALRDYLPKVTA